MQQQQANERLVESNQSSLEVQRSVGWATVHIFTRCGLLGRVRGHDAFWHGHDSAQVNEETDTHMSFWDTHVIVPDNPFRKVWDTLMIVILLV